jgi:hypothetical protein
MSTPFAGMSIALVMSTFRIPHPKFFSSYLSSSGIFGFIALVDALRFLDVSNSEIRSPHLSPKAPNP